MWIYALSYLEIYLNRKNQFTAEEEKMRSCKPKGVKKRIQEDVSWHLRTWKTKNVISY